MAHTVVGLFGSTAAAQEVKQALIARGYGAGSISIVANDHDEASTATTTSSAASAVEGIGYKIGNFFHSLTGGDKSTHSHYANGVNAGGALLAVRTDGEDAYEIAALLKQHGAQQIENDEADASVSRSAYAGEAANQTAIPVVEEELVVGKREVDRGGVRVYSHLVERQAEADVMLRDEQIQVERHAVNRPATAADFQTGAGSFELRASGEEAVVGKTSRVVEEVVVGKQASEHIEAVHDTVRKTEVEIEQIPGTSTSTSR